MGKYPTVVSLNHLDLRGIATYLYSAGQGIDLVTVVSIVLLVVLETMETMETMLYSENNARTRLNLPGENQASTLHNPDWTSS